MNVRTGKVFTIHSQVENVIILNGSQQGLDLVSRILLEPGDSISCEDLLMGGKPSGEG